LKIQFDSQWFDRVSGFELIRSRAQKNLKIGIFSQKNFQKLKKNQLGTQFTSSHDKNMTTIYITNYQKSFIARFNSSKIIRNFKNFQISFRDQFQGQLKKSLTNSTDSKKDKNQDGFWLVEQNVTPVVCVNWVINVTIKSDYMHVHAFTGKLTCEIINICILEYQKIHTYMQGWQCRNRILE